MRTEADGFQITLTEFVHAGCAVTWDAGARAAYTNVRPMPDSCRIAQTIDMGDFIVDLDPDDRVRGIEVLGHEIGLGDLLRVLRHTRWAPLPEEDAK